MCKFEQQIKEQRNTNMHSEDFSYYLNLLKMIVPFAVFLLTCCTVCYYYMLITMCTEHHSLLCAAPPVAAAHARLSSPPTRCQPPQAPPQEQGCPPLRPRLHRSLLQKLKVIRMGMNVKWSGRPDVVVLDLMWSSSSPLTPPEVA
jgi:hypothetical protein